MRQSLTISCTDAQKEKIDSKLEKHKVRPYQKSLFFLEKIMKAIEAKDTRLSKISWSEKGTSKQQLRISLTPEEKEIINNYASDNLAKSKKSSWIVNAILTY